MAKAENLKFVTARAVARPPVGTESLAGTIPVELVVASFCPKPAGIPETIWEELLDTASLPTPASEDNWLKREQQKIGENWGLEIFGWVVAATFDTTPIRLVKPKDLAVWDFDDVSQEIRPYLTKVLIDGTFERVIYSRERQGFGFNPLRLYEAFTPFFERCRKFMDPKIYGLLVDGVAKPDHIGKNRERIYRRLGILPQ